jgi:signal transduction histidine kinase/ActR/RegA family two-component response regulator
VALLAIAVATGFRSLMLPVIGDRTVYGFFIIATAFVDWRCGLRPALFCFFAGGFIGLFYFEKFHSLAPGEFNATPLLMSGLIGLAVIMVCESLRRMAIDNARLYREALEADRRKDEFLAMLAHELRNPLAPIRNALYVLDAIESPDAQVVGLRRIISSQTDQLIRLVDDLLDVSRITRGKIELRIGDVRLQDVVAAAVEMVRPLIDEKQHDLRVSVPDDDVIFRGDSVRLIQVVANLLNNAAKYTDKAGRIWVSADRRGDSIVLHVRDSGVGLTAEQIAQIFNLFEQVDSSIEKSRGGLGIGLTLSRRLVALHGGTLEATSPGLGSGSEFTVRLPAVIVESAKPKRKVEPKKRAPAAPRPLRVLVVDDIAATAASMAELMRLWNHAVDVAHDGFAALEKVRSFQPDVVLTDLGMPQMSGYRFAEELRRSSFDHEMMLVAVSGYAQQPDRERSRQAGFARHLGKPVDPNELKTILDDAAGRIADGVPV